MKSNFELLGRYWPALAEIGKMVENDDTQAGGESAGAASCTLLPLIEGSHKYFKRVIAQSGAPHQMRSPEQAIRCTNKVMEELGCKTVADLLAVSAEKFADVWARLYGLYQENTCL